MSIETIVNRTPETLGQQLEKARLDETNPVNVGLVEPTGFAEAPTQDQLPVYDRVTGKTTSREEVQTTPQTAETKPAGQVGYADHTQAGATAADLKVDRDFIVQGQPGTSGEIDQQIAELKASDEVLKSAGAILAEILKSPEINNTLRVQGLKVDEFEVFRIQVIGAFRHLGLDTGKFFGIPSTTGRVNVPDTFRS